MVCSRFVLYWNIISKNKEVKKWITKNVTNASNNEFLLELGMKIVDLSLL